MKDPVLVLGWIWAIYVAVRLGAEAVWKLAPAGRHSAASTKTAEHAGDRRPRWSPLPAVLWLAAEFAIAVATVGIAWLVLRDVTVNLVPAGVTVAPGDVRHVALVAILGWSLAVINVPVAWRLIGRLLPTESKKVDGGVDPERMGAAIGVLERLLIVALVPGGGSTAVGFVVAAKTLARFKELDKKRFAERYLLGTMASVTIALVSALAAQWVWTVAR